MHGDSKPSSAADDAASDAGEVEASVGGATLSLRAMSELLAVPAAILQSWDKANAILAAGSATRGPRRYTVSDVAALRRLTDERGGGPEEAGTAADAATPAPLTLCLQLLSATDTLDDRQIGATLDRGLHAFGLARTLDEVLLPSMREIGTRWSAGQCTADEEHLASGAVLSWLRRRADEAPPPRHERPVVLTCGPLDQHTIALDAFEVLLRYDRFDCRNLGAQTPVASLRAAVDDCSAQAVILVAHLASNRAAATAALRAVDQRGVAVFYAGAAFRTQATRRALPGFYLRANLGQAAAVVRARLRPSSPL